MVPPKKDVFADLFPLAAGSSQSSLNNLQNGSQNRIQTNTRTNLDWDLSSPRSNASPASVSGSSTPQTNADFDPFSIFEKAPAPKSEPKSTPTIPPQPETQVPRPLLNAKAQNGEISLLDDDFVDAFVPEPVQPVQRQEPRKEQPRSQDLSKTSESDTVLAGLVDIGFPVDVSNDAIRRVGPDLQACVNYIMNKGEPNTERPGASRPERGDGRDQASLQDMSLDFIKKASWFVEKSRRTVIKNISQLNQPNHVENNGMPAWMNSQQKYKEGAVEKQNGGNFEDYGTDEDNINAEEIQRIVRMQRQREKDRQRERFDRNGSASAKLEQPPSGRASPVKRPDDRTMSAKDGLDRPRESAHRRSEGSAPVQRKAQETVQPGKPIQRKADKPKATPNVPQLAAEVDLLGLGNTVSLSRAERFKASAGQKEAYVSPRRRNKAATKPKAATSEALNAFQQSDFDTFKAKATEAFTNGDYDNAFSSYNRCLEALPPKHELRIVIWSNLAVTLIKLGNYKLAKQHCDEGIALVGESVEDATWTINNKAIKQWYIKLLSRKAESLEMLENFEESLLCYMELITVYCMNDKKVMDAKRRVNNIVNPPKPQVKRPAAKSQVLQNTALVQKVRQQHDNEKAQEELKFRLHDQVHEKIQAWANGKEDNLRSLLMALPSILPAKLGLSFVSKPLTINDLMLTKKVKINYMKVISSIHPDKLSRFEMEDQMICQGVFVALNKAWDAFKEQNGVA